MECHSSFRSINPPSLQGKKIKRNNVRPLALFNNSHHQEQIKLLTRVGGLREGETETGGDRERGEWGSYRWGNYISLKVQAGSRSVYLCEVELGVDCPELSPWAVLPSISPILCYKVVVRTMPRVWPFTRLNHVKSRVITTRATSSEIEGTARSFALGHDWEKKTLNVESTVT